MTIWRARLGRLLRNWWILLLFLLLVFGIVALALLALSQNVVEPEPLVFIPVELHSKLEADYTVDPDPTRMPGVLLSIIRDFLYDQNPNANDIDARTEAVLNSLLTPVPIVTPSACQGVFTLLASRDTWTDPDNPAAIHGNDNYLQLGGSDGSRSRVMLYFPVDNTIPAGAFVYEARLEIDIGQQVAQDIPERFTLFSLASPFSELDTNWSNQPAPDRYYPAIQASNSSYVWDVTRLVREWLAGAAPNNGLAIDVDPAGNLSLRLPGREAAGQTNAETLTGSRRPAPRLIVDCGETVSEPEAIAAASTNTPMPVKTPAPTATPVVEILQPSATTTLIPLVPIPTLPPTTQPEPPAALPPPTQAAAPLPSTPVPPPTSAPSDGSNPAPPTSQPPPPTSPGGGGDPATATPTNVPATATATPTNVPATATPSPTATPLSGLNIDDVSIIEGDSGTQLAVFTVSLSVAGDTTISVDYATGGNTATPNSDFVTAGGALTFPAGTVTQTISVTVLGDSLDESNETFTVNLSNPTNATLSDATGLGIILDDDSASLSINDVSSIVEGNSGSHLAIFDITLSTTSAFTVTVDAATSDGTATAGSDYLTTSRTLTFSPGITRQTFAVLVNGDTLVETDEIFTVTLSNATNATLSDATGVGTILDDDTQTDLQISKTGTPNPVTAGRTLTYTLSITNAGPSDATGLVITDTLPAGVAFASAAGCSENGGVVTCTVAGLASGSSVQRTVVVTVNSATTGLLTNSVVISGSETDPDAANNSDAVTTTVQTGADLQVSKSAAPNPVTAGRTLTYTLFITNAGPSDATGLVITDTLPAGVAFASAAGCSENGGVVTCTVAGLASGSSVQRTVAVTVNSATTGLLTNSVVISGSETDPDAANNSDAITTVIQTSADLALTKADSSDPIAAGGTLTYTLTVTNSGPSDAPGLTVTDTLPLSVTFLSASTGCGANGGGLVTCTATSLAAGASTQFTISLAVDGAAVGVLTNTAIADSLATDSALVNNSAVETTTITGQANLNVTKLVNNAAPLVADFITFTITINNAGPEPATNVSLSDLLPGGLGFVSNVTSQGSYSSVTGLWTAGAISNGSAVTLTLVATPTTAGTVTNTAQIVTADQIDPNSTPGNNDPTEDDQASAVITATLPILSINDVTVTEGDSGSVTATFTISLSQASNLTAGVNYATANNTAIAGSDYTTASGVLNFPAGITVQTFTVAITGDTKDELDETFFVNLTNPVNATVAKSQGAGAIVDDDNPSLVITDVSLAEGDSGSANAVFTVTLSAIGVETATVGYATANGTATIAGSDYIAASGTLTFSPGITQRTLFVPVIGDTSLEADETFFVNLSNPTKATIVDGQGIGTIINDDELETACSTPVATLTTVADIYIENGGGATPDTNQGTEINLRTRPPVGGNQQRALLRFNLESIPAGSTVSCATMLVTQKSTSNTGQQINLHRVTKAWTEGDGTNNNGATWNKPDKSLTATWTTVGGDYETAISASFVPSSTSHIVNITSLTQFWVDNPQTNFGLLFDPQDVGSNNSISFASREDTVNLPPRLAIEYVPGLTISDATVIEGNSGVASAVFSVTLSGPGAQTVTTDYATFDNTATIADDDYIATSGTLTFTPGITTQTITVTINGDTKDEANETFLVNLSNPTNAGIADGQGIGIILDDEIGGMALPGGSQQIYLPAIIRTD